MVILKIMIYLGIDYGKKRIGLAKADDKARIAIPLMSVANDEKIFRTIGEIVAGESVNEVVLGIPVSFDGKEYGLAQEARVFGETLAQKVDKKVHFQNEILTTAQAKRHEVGDIDASAAALILQSFLDRINGK